MTVAEITTDRSALLAQLLSDDTFIPSEPTTIKETGLPDSMIEALIVKRFALAGICSGRLMADHLGLPFTVMEEVLSNLRQRQWIVHRGAAPLNDYHYVLTEAGQERAQEFRASCAYAGPAPVPLMDYLISAEAQTIRAESPKRDQLLKAFAGISIDERLFNDLGPAINSGAGLFLYGEPGNGKSTLAKCITRCFGEEIWVPHAMYDDGQIIKIFDSSIHQPAVYEDDAAAAPHDRRWVKIRRPTVVVGGELTMDALEIRHDPRSNVSEAPLQVKSNGGCLLIDDFGRQRIEPRELLNRWIIPLENRVDYLTLASGKKIQVPFEQLIIFSTNLSPEKLVDEAFMRRIPYKIEIGNPSRQEFHYLFKLYCAKMNVEFLPQVVDQLIQQHYIQAKRPLRRCHPRDLLLQIRNYCTYNDLKVEMRPEYFDRACRSYFSVINARPA